MVDHIIVMTDGQISEEGSYDKLMSHQGAFASFLQEFFHKQAKDDMDEEKEEDPDSKAVLVFLLESNILLCNSVQEFY